MKRYLAYNTMMFFRPFIFIFLKVLGAVMFVAGLWFFFMTTGLWGKINGVFCCVCPFLFYLLRDFYDLVIFRIKPDNIRLFLTKQ
jgi:hypothetical protein